MMVRRKRRRPKKASIQDNPGGSTQSNSVDLQSKTVRKPKANPRARRVRQKKRKERHVKRVPSSQIIWPILNGVPYTVSVDGKITFGVIDSKHCPLSQRQRMKHIKYARAYIAGLLYFRPGQSLERNDYHYLRSLGQGWYTLKVCPFPHNDGIIRRMIAIAVQCPSRFVTIYGASYASLCRRPTCKFNSQMGRSCSVASLLSNPKASKSALLKSKKVKAALKAASVSADQVSKRLSLLDPGISWVSLECSKLN
jgi:hypothetical protein